MFHRSFAVLDQRSLSRHQRSFERISLRRLHGRREPSLQIWSGFSFRDAHQESVGAIKLRNDCSMRMLESVEVCHAANTR